RMLRLVILSCFITICGSQKWTKVAMQRDTCSNLTQVLDNWKFAILSQVKDMLINDHNIFLPEYSRIQPLSDALGDLYTQFNKLKEELKGLTANVDKVETLVDEISHGRPLPGRPLQRVPPGAGQRSALRTQMRGPVRPVPAAQLRRARRRGAH
uniref:Uncharacterized protein n=1 Tax=Neogobius melanostomus TaxID=47308 RepID=A0A8C6WL29_9GOBI